jgi:hypothetical protein
MDGFSRHRFQYVANVDAAVRVLFEERNGVVRLRPTDDLSTPEEFAALAELQRRNAAANRYRNARR